MTDTPRLKLPEIAAAQAQKHVTHNEAIVKLDAFCDLYFLGQYINDPPSSPSDGDTYLIGGTPTGDWVGYDYKISYQVDGGWRFYAPFNGLRAYVATSGDFIIYEDGNWNAWSPSGTDTFAKADYDSVGFSKTGAGTISVKAGTKVSLLGVTYDFAYATAVTMPTLTAGTDYAIYLCNDGTVRADANFSYPTGYSASTSRKIGGFHYAPGGNASGTSGGDTTPAINPYSIWDLKWRPACPDPRGMALIGGGFWCDIYLCNTAPEANGTSAYNVTIADGSSPPKIPSAFGGDGSTAYGSFNWWEASEVMSAAGKQLLSYSEFAAAMYGTTEGASYGTDPGSTVLREAYTSRWGIMLATGNMWVWSRDFSYYPGTGSAGWKDQTQSRGQIYLANDTGLVAALFGGDWSNGADAGSRASLWNYYPWDSGATIGARGRCDHMRLA